MTARDGVDKGLLCGTCAGYISIGRRVSASPLRTQAAFSSERKHANRGTIAKQGKTDNQNTPYLGLEQQIIPGHLSYGIQVRTDVSCIPHFHQRSPAGGCFPRTRKDSSFQLHVRFPLTDCKKIN